MNSKSLRRYLLAGLVVWLPVVVTLFILGFIIDLLDRTMALLPNAYQPEQLLGVHIPGLGVLLSMLVLFFTGLVVTNILGQRVVAWGEAILSKIPLVRSIYNATKQVISTILANDSQAFRKVVLVQYPREGLWSLAFQTGSAVPEATRVSKEKMITLFVPTTPNPTSGFIIMVEEKDIIELSMPVDEALKYIISLGVMRLDTQTITSN